MTQENIKHKIHKPQSKKMLVSYGKTAQLGWFKHNFDEIPKTQDYVIIKTQRGLEIGKIVGKFCYKHGQFRWDDEKVSQYYQEQNKGDIVADAGVIERMASGDDVSEWKHLELSAKNEMKLCEKIVKEMKVEMKLVDAEHIFGGERIIFYFIADGRVDFRELVKRLAREFQTRIEMRQIGARDEAKLICDFETCGQPCCCAQYLKILKPVNMRMAKLQKATLDPSKISGYCGRLKCCLRYEDQTYRELKKIMPKRGLWVETPEGTGQVVDSQLLTELVIVRDSNGSKYAVGLEDIKVIPEPAPSAKKRPEKTKYERPTAARNKPEKNRQKQNQPERKSHLQEELDEVAEIMQQVKEDVTTGPANSKDSGNTTRNGNNPKAGRGDFKRKKKRRKKRKPNGEQGKNPNGNSTGAVSDKKDSREGNSNNG